MGGDRKFLYINATFNNPSHWNDISHDSNSTKKGWDRKQISYDFKIVFQAQLTFP